MDEGRGKWIRLALMSGATSALLLYQIFGATEAPSTALKVMQYGLLALALFALIGALVKMMNAR
ncbi:hypothetical protein E8L99_03345 [Phreatobacter aquaticus]|uniref:Uncharacterized protein n=1 Tax=Phreatobacter aquaticus TaxID=2570229 RepID=A0A4D7QHD6_9HYPH|nr:hypothetical protein [Phreatobacter aquaticus]QCK84884.1 hypothetical protein E8L99_03345 [Phreatobacter aquaticus]